MPHARKLTGETLERVRAELRRRVYLLQELRKVSIKAIADREGCCHDVIERLQRDVTLSIADSSDVGSQGAQ
jgi:hypothetical protein